jgi:hypothetical protein
LIKFRKHIAIILIGIFIFPVAFQSVHIVRHHGHEHSACLHICKIHSEYQGSYIQTPEKDKHCPICEYKFAINNLPSVSVYEANIPIIKLALDETIIGHPYLEVIESKSPRAPPLSL